jgi:hypothetical protein
MINGARWYWHHQRAAFSGYGRWVMDGSSFVAIPGAMIALFWDPGNDLANWLIGIISFGLLFWTLVVGPLRSAYAISLAKDATIAEKDAEIRRLTSDPRRLEKLGKLQTFIDRLEACQDLLGHVPGTPHFMEGQQLLVSVDQEIKEFLKTEFPKKLTLYLRTYLGVPGDNSLLFSFCADRLWDLKQIFAELSHIA